MDNPTPDAASVQLEVTPLADVTRATSGRIDAFLSRWLGFVKAHPVVLHLLVAAALIAIADLVITVTRAQPSPALESLPLEGGIVLVSLAVPAIITAVSLRHEFRAMLRVIDVGPPAAAPVLMRFVREELDVLQELVDDLRTQGALVDAAHVSDWVRRRCFEVTRGRYIACDSCVPSDYLRRYTKYLVAHADYLKRTGCKDSVRINVASTDGLITDSNTNPDAFKRYVEWHRQYGVILLHLDRRVALDIAHRHNLGTIIDWTYWQGELALAWDYEESSVRMRLAFVGESVYRRAHEFLRELLEEARPFDALPI